MKKMLPSVPLVEPLLSNMTPAERRRYNAEAKRKHRSSLNQEQLDLQRSQDRQRKASEAAKEAERLRKASQAAKEAARLRMSSEAAKEAARLRKASPEAVARDRERKRVRGSKSSALFQVIVHNVANYCLIGCCLKTRSWKWKKMRN